MKTNIKHHPIERVQKIAEQYKDNHLFLGPTILIPGLALTDCNRAQMFTSHIQQRLQVLHPQKPLMFTGNENQWGKYSSGYLQLKGEWKILYKIKKSIYKYDLIVQKIKYGKDETKENAKFKVGEYHVIQRNECTHLTEKYGYKHDNKVIDNLKTQETIADDTVLYKDNNRDDEMNLCYGRNLKAAYLSHKGLTTEDSIIISKSASYLMGYYEVKIVEVSLNTNDIFINMYGDKKIYKAFPDIGESCKKGLLCATRRINYATAPITLSNVRKLISDDTKYTVKGKVVDIEVISNIDNPDEVLNSTYNEQIKKYYDTQQAYYKEFIKIVKPIVTNRNKKISKDLVDLYNYYSKLVDPNNKFLVGDNLFDHLKLKFTILRECPLTVGSKLAGRYGNKGVVSKILPDDEMPKLTNFAGLGPVDENSKINFNIDIILNPLGVINRLNPQQNIEVEINYNSLVIRYKMERNWNKWTLQQEKKYLLNYIKIVDKKQYKIMNDYMSNLCNSELEELLIEIIENGIPINQPPINGAKNIIDLARIYNYTKADRSKFLKIKNTLIFGELYMMTLKHTPSSKFSVRSIDQLSIKNIPVKSIKYKQYKADYSTNAIRIGEMENTNLLLANPANTVGMKCNKEYLDALANNEQMRMSLTEQQLIGNPYDFDVEISDTRSENSKIFRTFANCLQLDIED